MIFKMMKMILTITIIVMTIVIREHQVRGVRGENEEQMNME